MNPHDDQSLLRILGTPPRGLAAKAVEQLKIGRAVSHKPMLEQLGEPEFRKSMSAKAAEAALELSEVFREYAEKFTEPGQLAGKIVGFLRSVGYLDGLQRIYKDLNDAMKRRENVDEFINAVAQFEERQTEPPTLENYLESFALLEENDRTDDEENNGDAVTLSTVHASKGLEFPIVFCVALERNIFPHERAVEEGSVEEELRLFYVAITRARRQLYITRAAQRMQRGMAQAEFALSVPRTPDRRCGGVPGGGRAAAPGFGGFGPAGFRGHLQDAGPEEPLTVPHSVASRHAAAVR